MEQLERIRSELEKFSKKIIKLNPPLEDESLVLNFEEKYNIILPYDFKMFLKIYNGFDLMGISVYGFYGKENIQTVYEYEHFRVFYPQYDYIVPFSPDGRGNFYCLDTKISNSIVNKPSFQP